MLFYYPRVMALLSVLLIWLFWNSEKNFDDHEVELEPRRVPATRSLNILILVVLNADSDPGQYTFPLGTLECYAQRHGYNLKIVDDSKFREICPQKDGMFRRHCVAAHFLETTEWLLFLDADIAVVNPDRLIEEYLVEGADLLMYNRFTSWEIAMGSYLVKNTTWARRFLQKFANYETRLPNSFHGTDNGAIHAFVVEELMPEALPAAEQCLHVWRMSTGFEDLFLFEACIREILGAWERIGKLMIVPKGRGWVRDVWLTQSMWSPERDFMLHGFKTTDRRTRTGISFIDWITRLTSHRFMWFSFLNEDLSRGNCNWEYDSELLARREEVDSILQRIYRQVERRRRKTVARLSVI